MDTKTKKENEEARLEARQKAIEALRIFVKCEHQCNIGNAEIAQDFSSLLCSASDHQIITDIKIQPDKFFTLSKTQVNYPKPK